ncbi:Borealin N terminal-domain-containing protein [Pseudomassariella vexata]|uniref:Borealin N terminal-domain-containing protein n=1 Tax=Pseudomassariella vexata TaxID=1141098 RepID=A0A1Y2DLL1_9PEZI|nr:Borealin N terminal-domain-containing protein [Pseudomassariella vexata]ORY60147.1 Borealin N terminal-domain-containing protein [Pseudomassariella vexata]
MAPIRSRKRKSDVSMTSPAVERHAPMKMGTPPQRSPIRRKLGISVAQKQALVDNLQLELTERARRLRAQYNVQAQQLRSRVEMRVNRIPTSLRRAKMGDLLAKHTEPSQQQQSRAPRSPFVARPPPVPAKDGTSPKPIPRKVVPAARPKNIHKRSSDDITGANDKENSVEPVGQPKKRLRAGPTGTDTTRSQPAHVLSPASTNVRITHRTADRPPSPTKSMIARPVSPIKTKSSGNILSNMVEKAKGTRGAAATRKVTASSTASLNAGGMVSKARKPPVPTPAAAGTTAATRGRRKLSATSESSETSSGTVVRKAGTTKAFTVKAAPTAKRTVMGTIKSATSKRAPALKAPAAPANPGRTLRKRQA